MPSKWCLLPVTREIDLIHHKNSKAHIFISPSQVAGGQLEIHDQYSDSVSLFHLNFISTSSTMWALQGTAALTMYSRVDFYDYFSRRHNHHLSSAPL